MERNEGEGTKGERKGERRKTRPPIHISGYATAIKQSISQTFFLAKAITTKLLCPLVR